MFYEDMDGFEMQNLIENLVMIVGKERLVKAAQAPTGEATLLILSGKELE
jgi:hypothetical protein